jgi:purine-nucleoside phosphorylase
VDQLDEAARFVRGKIDSKPKIALVLGSGLGDFAESVSIRAALKAVEIPHYPVGSVKGHAGRLIFGTIEDGEKSSAPLLLFQGRVHYYENGDIEKVVFPIQLASKLGVQVLLLTNAAGGVNDRFESGQLMLMRGYLNLAKQLPIADPRYRRRNSTRRDFDADLQRLFLESAKALGIKLQEGVYCWLHGPSYETAAEIKMLRILGADAVGMSTVPEIIKAKSLGMRVAAMSLISNMATGLSSTKLSHQEVTETANRLQQSFTALMKKVILQIR